MRTLDRFFIQTFLPIILEQDSLSGLKFSQETNSFQFQNWNLYFESDQTIEVDFESFKKSPGKKAFFSKRAMDFNHSEFPYETKIQYSSFGLLSNKFSCWFHLAKDKIKTIVDFDFYLYTSHKPTLANIDLNGVGYGLLHFRLDEQEPSVLNFATINGGKGRTWSNEEGKDKFVQESKLLTRMGLVNESHSSDEEKYTLSPNYILFPEKSDRYFLKGITKGGLEKMLSPESVIAKSACIEFVRLKDSAFFQNILNKMEKLDSFSMSMSAVQKEEYSYLNEVITSLDSNRQVCLNQLDFKIHQLTLNYYFQIIFHLTKLNAGFNFKTFISVVDQFMSRSKIGKFLDRYKMDISFYLDLFLLDRVVTEFFVSVATVEPEKKVLFWNDVLDYLEERNSIDKKEMEFRMELTHRISKYKLIRIPFLERRKLINSEKTLVVIAQNSSENSRVEREFEQMANVNFWSKKSILKGFEYILYLVDGSVLRLQILDSIQVLGMKMIPTNKLFKIGNSYSGEMLQLNIQDDKILEFVYHLIQTRRWVRNELKESFPDFNRSYFLFKEIWDIDINGEIDLQKLKSDLIKKIISQNSIQAFFGIEALSAKIKSIRFNLKHHLQNRVSFDLLSSKMQEKLVSTIDERQIDQNSHHRIVIVESVRKKYRDTNLNGEPLNFRRIRSYFLDSWNLFLSRRKSFKGDLVVLSGFESRQYRILRESSRYKQIETYFNVIVRPKVRNMKDKLAKKELKHTKRNLLQHPFKLAEDDAVMNYFFSNKLEN